MRKKWKLYVWESVLCDWTCGMIVAVASLDAEARAIVGKAHRDCFTGDSLAFEGVEPQIICFGDVKEPMLWECYGGG